MVSLGLVLNVVLNLWVGVTLGQDGGRRKGPDTKEHVERVTDKGRVRGYVHTVLPGMQVERYFAIPFARPPVGSLRLEYPQPAEPWTGVLDATQLSPACPQVGQDWHYLHRHLPGFSRWSEDCLYLNVYVPRTRQAGRLLPVLVHVHGGSNEVGMGAMLHADVLAAKTDLVVVSFNYRLGPLGFLNMASREFPGNYGLLDQIEAFRWVQANIRNFDGDPGQVTVEGHSAGGGDVGFHMLSPLSKGLFRHVIMQSGSPTAYWAVVRPPQTTTASTQYLAELQGCPRSPPHVVKECLKKSSLASIVSEKFFPLDNHEVFQYTPVVDGHLLTDVPEVLLEKGQINGQAFMAGVTRDEGSLTYYWNAAMIQDQNETFRFTKVFADAFLPPIRHIRSIEGIADLLLYEYKPWLDPDNATANIVGLSDVVGDTTFVAPAVNVAEYLANRQFPVFMYSFEYFSHLTTEPAWLGVPHGRDLFYLFGYPFIGHPLYNYSEEDRAVSEGFMQLWGSFVKHGELRHPETSLMFEPYVAETKAFVKVSGYNGSATLDCARHLRGRQVAFWNYLLPSLARLQGDKSTIHEPTLVWAFIAICALLTVLLVSAMACAIHYRHMSRRS